jgi:hypothetical protein
MDLPEALLRLDQIETTLLAQIGSCALSAQSFKNKQATVNWNRCSTPSKLPSFLA